MYIQPTLEPNNTNLTRPRMFPLLVSFDRDTPSSSALAAGVQNMRNSVAHVIGFVASPSLCPHDFSGWSCRCLLASARRAFFTRRRWEIESRLVQPCWKASCFNQSSRALTWTLDKSRLVRWDFLCVLSPLAVLLVYSNAQSH